MEQNKNSGIGSGEICILLFAICLSKFFQLECSALACTNLKLMDLQLGGDLNRGYA